MAEIIVRTLPPHSAYVETCCGGASVFWAKSREMSRSEVLNDRDGELINFYQELHLHGRRLAAAVDAMPYSRALFAATLSSRPKGRFQRAVRFWYLNRVAFGGKQRGQSFGVQAKGRALVLPVGAKRDLDEIVERLRGVSFEAVDVVRLVELYDRADTLFYVDPPFWGSGQPYACQFTDEDHLRLARTLLRIRGVFILSYNDCPAVRGLYARCTVRQMGVRYTIGSNSSAASRSDGAEVLIQNRSSYVAETT